MENQDILGKKSGIYHTNRQISSFVKKTKDI